MVGVLDASPFSPFILSKVNTFRPLKHNFLLYFLMEDYYARIVILTPNHFYKHIYDRVIFSSLLNCTHQIHHTHIRCSNNFTLLFSSTEITKWLTNSHLVPSDNLKTILLYIAGNVNISCDNILFLFPTYFPFKLLSFLCTCWHKLLSNILL